MLFVIIFLGFIVLTGIGLWLFTALIARSVEKVVPPLGSFVEVEGARIHYLDRGSGPTLLLIHGLGSTMRTFTHSMLERLTGEFRVVVMERPGSGESTRARNASARLGSQAKTVSAFIYALGLDRPLLVGHSLGGAVALAVALNHPEQVRGLALLAPFAHVQEEVPPIFKRLFINSPALRRLAAWTLATPASMLRRKQTLEAIFGPDRIPRDFAIAGGGLLSLRPKSFCAASEDLVAIKDEMPAMVERYSTLQIPVGILYGTGDRILDHRHHGVAVASKIPGVELELTDGGHMLPLSAPERAVALVRRVAERSYALSGSEASQMADAGVGSYG